jgi:hypothetical protein
MACLTMSSPIATINDGTSRLDFYGDTTSSDGCDFAHRHFSLVQWTYPVNGINIIRPNDFVAEPINNIANGIPGGKYPLKVNTSNIIGYTPQADADSTKGGTVQVCQVQVPDRQVRFRYTTVNEFNGSPDLQCGTGNGLGDFSNDVVIDNTYTLDGSGNITVDSTVIWQAGYTMPSVIQNLHFVELLESPSLYGFNYEVDWSTPFGNTIQTYDTQQWFSPTLSGFDSTQNPTYMLFDPSPKAGYNVNTAFPNLFCSRATLADWYYIYPYQNPRVLGISRKLDLPGQGVLVVHGNLPAGSQPCIVGVQGDGGIVPIVTQFAMASYSPGTQKTWRVSFLPMDGSNNAQQKARALQMANYTNPIG